MRHGHDELERVGAVEFKLDRVLRKSKVSYSSLYHHFGSREGFIIALEFERVLADQMRDMELMRMFLLGSDEPRKVFEAIEFALAVAGEEAGRLRRQHRVESLAAASQSRRLRERLAEAQVIGSRHFAETLRLAAEKGVFNITLPIDGVAYVVQSLFVGRILVDITGDKVVDQQWVTTAVATIRYLLGQE